MRAIVVGTLTLDTLQNGLDVGFPKLHQTWPYHINCSTQGMAKGLDPYRKYWFKPALRPAIRQVCMATLIFRQILVALDVSFNMTHHMSKYVKGFGSRR